MTEIVFNPIGTVHSPFQDPRDMPIQPIGARGVRGRIELDPAYTAGLKDLEGFSRVILLYHLHRSKGYALEVVPFLDKTPHGIFATRAPRRPNAIGLSVLKLVRVDGATLTVEDVDILDGTPVIDIKPYVPAFDAYPDERAGWLAATCETARTMRSDDRFC
ncbi:MULTISPECIES: tRNA (N6-threonylcarbamoyladenosine(37)-N6)-methyltransferase TrmO [unclassified Methanoculleus]|jgi:tRNA-Thr(GGU) m(6)t(6)A37 methyltransferase TsaA|uniref:tRNA (N6-threonylcarbamoyladenosine(37)-N6)-methyltransferase TrmO n=1 Tax=Methanoculleus palmolei TaxID=72612 RepID=A0ABD8A756_9EURY|nr:tRNA (N6-threonylcarbamoyladenosine(37)-N6)-methyltransferase TrmO [Methanoculleus sp. UBA377]WOX54842.1 tRNA (N6-threonylcarbamoyladenosine(37)-N6)-methyltransferase TrmO [Methanoculleus palmolei]